MNSIGQKLRKTAFHTLWRGALELRSRHAWERSDKSGAPPHRVKELALEEYAARHCLSVLVETGTYFGDMVAAVQGHFSHVYSIEIDQALFERARDRFSGYQHIEILLGDSGERLRDLIGQLGDGTVFWLDGHYSGGVTGRGAVVCPIIQELTAIFNSPLCCFAILIDDARLFVGENDYPTLEELRQFVSEHRPQLKFEVKHDMIRIYP